VSRRPFLAFLGALLLGFAPAASAQIGAPDPDRVRVRLGPIWMNPTISLTNIGIDRNVFNVAPEDGPVRDFTFSVAPNTDIWLRLGRTWIVGQINETINWYQKYASERSATNEYSLKWAMPVNRLELHTNIEYSSEKNRPGFEIDARVQRKHLTYGGSVEVKALTKTFFGVTYAREGMLFDETAVFKEVNLHDELSRKSTTSGLLVRHQLTPLTAFSINATQTTETFDFTSLRDSTSRQISGSMSFDPFALIKGGATIGYRSFRPTPDLPPFKGLTFDVNLSYAVFGTTRFSVISSRDVQYSFDNTQPYYLQTAVSGSIAQQIFGPFDVVARAGTSHMAYRDRADAKIAVVDRVDESRNYGVGVGFHMGKDLRLGFNLDHVNRYSAIASREFANVLFGSQITYGVP
jgi:hypothetical protein